MTPAIWQNRSPERERSPDTLRTLPEVSSAGREWPGGGPQAGVAGWWPASWVSAEIGVSGWLCWRAGDHRWVTDAELIRRAEAAGVAASYLDWRKRRVQVNDETLAAILQALDQAGHGVAGHSQGGRAGVVSAPAALPRLPAERAWGFTVQLYSVRSRQSWGHGDFRDLADLATWSARDHGAGFIRIETLTG